MVMPFYRFYKITHIPTGNIYVGHTQKTLQQRLNKQWKSRTDKHGITAIAKVMKGSGVKSDFCIELLREQECDNKKSARIIEQEEIKKISPELLLNKDKAYRSQEEKLEYARQYHHANREKINVRRRKYYEKNRERHKAKAILYRMANSEELKAKKREYYKRTESERKKVTQCPCGGHYVKYGKARHFRRQKHIDYIKATGIGGSV